MSNYKVFIIKLNCIAKDEHGEIDNWATSLIEMYQDCRRRMNEDVMNMYMDMCVCPVGCLYFSIDPN